MDIVFLTSFPLVKHIPPVLQKPYNYPIAFLYSISRLDEGPVHSLHDSALPNNSSGSGDFLILAHPLQSSFTNWQKRQYQYTGMTMFLTSSM